MNLLNRHKKILWGSWGKECLSITCLQLGNGWIGSQTLVWLQNLYFGHVFLIRDQAVLDAVCLYLFDYLKWPIHFASFIVLLWVAQFLLFFFFCVKKEKGKTRKRKLQMDFEKLKICGPISLLSVPNLCLKSREQESIVLDYWNIPLECLWQTWHKNSSKGRQTLLGLLLGPVPDFC